MRPVGKSSVASCSVAAPGSGATRGPRSVTSTPGGKATHRRFSPANTLPQPRPIAQSGAPFGVTAQPTSESPVPRDPAPTSRARLRRTAPSFARFADC